MKKLLISLILISSFNFLPAQKQLQIDSVFTICKNFGANSNFLDSVPINKVWKIESVQRTTTTAMVNYNTVGPSPYIKINNKSIQTDPTNIILPIWLGPKDKLEFGHSGSYASVTYVFSIIQFKLE